MATTIFRMSRAEQVGGAAVRCQRKRDAKGNKWKLLFCREIRSCRSSKEWHKTRKENNRVHVSSPPARRSIWYGNVDVATLMIDCQCFYGAYFRTYVLFLVSPELELSWLTPQPTTKRKRDLARRQANKKAQANTRKQRTSPSLWVSCLRDLVLFRRWCRQSIPDEVAN